MPPAPPEQLNFELMAYRAVDAQETIAAKRSPISAAAAAAATNEWWGDEYWRTKRNQAVWDAKSQPRSPHSPPKTLRTAPSNARPMLPAELNNAS